MLQQATPTPVPMPDEPVLVARARAMGAWQGVAVDGEARIRLHQRGIILAWHDSAVEWRLPFTELAGITVSGDALELHAAGSKLTLTSQHGLQPILDTILDRACTLPELARGARTVGSRRGSSGDPATQARFFAPVLEARRRAELSTTADGKVRALDGAFIAARVNGLLGELARSRWPSDLPEQRALGAELEECCEAMFAACEALSDRARDWQGAPDERRLEAWREWVVAAARVFAAADRAWSHVGAALTHAAHP